jgi:fucose 4-O-acetylase-like acetyltransferase
VPLFLIISGFLIGSRQSSRAKLRLYFRKFLRLHVLYGALYWILEPLRGLEYAPITLKGVLMHFAGAAYAGQFYLFVLPQLYFVLAFLVPERFWGSTKLLLGSLLLGAGTVALLAWSFETRGADPMWRLLASQEKSLVFLWLFPFCLGMWVGVRFASAPRAPGSAAFCLLLVVLALSAAALDLPATAGAEHADQFPYARWSIGLGAALLAFTLPWVSRSLRLSQVGALGRESFGIFVLNPFILSVLQGQLGAATSVPESMLHTAVTLGIAFPLTRALRKRIPIAFP